MKIGILIGGLGQSVHNDTVDNYAKRLINELNYTNTDAHYFSKKEVIHYTSEKSGAVVSIIKNMNNNEEIIYKIYQYQYKDILTEKFNSYSLIHKNIRLFLLVLRKFPLIITRLFKPKQYNSPFQTFYLFSIFLILALAFISLLPATFITITDFSDKFKLFDSSSLETFITGISKLCLTITGIMVLFLPNANVLVTQMGTEFVCVHDYLKYGAQRQILQGNLEQLVEYITENENDCKIHFHAYSFGSIIALDYIYPFGNKVSKNAEKYCDALITIGSPYEFVNAYYPLYFENRNLELDSHLSWLNVYSITDVLATNFRNDAKVGEAQFGIDLISNKPININYEVIALSKFGIIDFLMLYGVKAHEMYWDEKPNGQSCLRLILMELEKNKFITP